MYDERSFYNFKLFDLSQFSGWYAGNDVSSYSTAENTVVLGVQSSDETVAVNQPLFVENLSQNRSYEV